MKPQFKNKQGIILLLAILSAWIGVTPALAQSVPATAREAASSPRFASRLAPPSGGRATQAQHPRRQSSCSQRPADDSTIYSNGPINGNVDAWTINFGFTVADSFTVDTWGGGATLTGMTFAAWLYPGDTLYSAQLSITSDPLGGTTYFTGVVNFTQSGCTSNNFGFLVCQVQASFNVPNLNNGTYWVSLQNANVSSGDPAYWDENSGPSQGVDNELGTIPSESFTILGETSSTSTTSPRNYCVPEQSGNFSIIHDFDGNDGALPEGVAIDRAGNLYGQALSNSGNGTIYKLTQRASAWILTTVYNFLGGASGSSPQGVMVGPHDNLYGAAQGGLQNCSNGYCGLIFDLRPGPTACVTAMCNWMETPIYNFTGPTDAAGGGALVSDEAGNLYGVSASGGAQQQGAVFQLTPTIGGWSENLLYSFTGGNDGGFPTTVIVGNDGHLYGMTENGGASGGGVVFQLTRSGNGWTESVLYNIPAAEYIGSNPHSLIQDSSGNLYGIYEYLGCCASATGRIFMLSPSNGNWVYTELHHGNDQLDGDDLFPNMTLDAAGNLLGTETAYSGCMNTVDFAYIFELTRGDGWQYSTPLSWGNTYWAPSGSLAMDTSGNLYGTTAFCGAYDQGAVWELSGIQ
jgi:uncharacterized repeat protein (TIGR03803 family)